MYDDVLIQQPTNWGCDLNRSLSGWWLALPHLSQSSRVWDVTGQHNHGVPSSAFLNNWKIDGQRKLGATRTNITSASIQSIYVGLTSSGVYTMSGWFAALGFGTGGFGFNTLFGFSNSGYSFVAFNVARGVTVWGSGSGEPAGSTAFTWPNTSDWQHLTVVRTGNSGSYRTYLNGQHNGTVAAGSGFATSAPFAIQGRGDSAINFDGYGCDFRLYRDRALSAADCLRLYEDSLRHHPDTLNRRRKKVWIAGSAPVYTAEAVLTVGAVSLSSDSTYTAGTFDGQAVLGVGHTKISVAATFVAPVYTATAVLVTASVVLDATASFISPVYDATAALVVGSVVLDATATITSPIYTATAALVVGGVVFDATGLVTSPVYDAAVILTTAGVVLDATATITSPVYTANAVLVTGSTTLEASSTMTSPVYAATAALAIAAVEFSGLGLFDPPVYDANAALVTGSTSLSGSGVFGAVVYTGVANLIIATTQFSATAEFDSPVYSATASLSIGTIEFSGEATFDEVRIATASLIVAAVQFSASALFMGAMPVLPDFFVTGRAVCSFSIIGRNPESYAVSGRPLCLFSVQGILGDD